MDNEISYYSKLFNFRVENVKKYSSLKCDSDVVYFFKDMDEYKNYFISNGLDKVDDEILNYCKFIRTKGGLVIAFKNLCDYVITMHGVLLNEGLPRSEGGFISSFDVKYSKDRFSNIHKKYRNAFEVKNNMILFYPPNDGCPHFPFEFFQDGKLIIDNKNAFSQINNLDDILIKITDIIDKGLDKGFIVNPYGFMLELTDNVLESYCGNGSLVISNQTIRNKYLNSNEIDDAKKYFVNVFLDHFIGWNFGVSVNRNEFLKNKLEELNNKVIDLGIREDAGPGFEVFGNSDMVSHGVQHYYFSKTKDKTKIK